MTFSSQSKSDLVVQSVSLITSGATASSQRPSGVRLVGVVVAFQLAYPDLNIEPWFNFGRMRPLHTSAVIFAFGGNALIWRPRSTSCSAPRAHALFGGDLAGSCSGATSCSSSWRRPATCWAPPRAGIRRAGMVRDLWLTVVWVAYLLTFLGTLLKRKEPHIYVANWFY
jgi:cytochrome c oxidase cbb3-type subunit 1